MRLPIGLRMFLMSLIILSMLHSVNSAVVNFNGDDLVICESNLQSCNANDNAGGNFRYDVRDYQDPGNLESSVTIDDCADGEYNDPTHPWFDGDWIFEDVADISRIDLNGTNASGATPYPGGLTDNYLRAGDDIEITVTFLCSADRDTYNILYKNNTNTAVNDWQLLTTGFCISNDFVGYTSQEIPISITKTVDDVVGNHTIRAIISYSGYSDYLSNPNAICGDEMPYPSTTDTDDLVFEVIDKIDLEEPEITVISPADGELIELTEDQTIQVIINITDQTGIDKVSISLSYDNSTTELNYTQIGNTYTANITNLTALGQYTLIYFANDTIETNSTTKKQNHVNNDTTSTFVLKDDVGFNIFSPIFNKAYDSLITLLDFFISDINTPYNEVYYIHDSKKVNLNHSKNITITQGLLGKNNNTASNLSQSFTLSKNTTIQRIDILIQRTGADKNRTLYLREDSDGPNGTVIAEGNFSGVNSSQLEWKEVWLNDAVNITSGNKYWIHIENDNSTDYIEWSYSNDSTIGESYLNGSLDLASRIFELYSYNTTFTSLTGFNTLQLCENNSFGNEECSYTQYYIDLNPPTFPIVSYDPVVEYGNDQEISIKITDSYAGVNTSYTKIEYEGTNRSMQYNSNNARHEYTISNLSPGTYNFTVYAIDNLGWKNSSGPHSFSYGDNVAPVLDSIIYLPNGTQDLDPNRTIVFNFTITDLGGLSSDVYLQYRPNTTSIWTDVLASNISEGEYTANFTPSLETMYYFRVNAKDNFANELNSTEQELDIGYERTWSINPISYNVVHVDAGETLNLYNVTIANLGDVASSYSIAKGSLVSYAMVFSNSSFTLEPNQNMTVIVNITAPGIGEYYSTADISCLTGCEIPTKTAGSRIKVGGEGPFLDLKFYRKELISGDYYYIPLGDSTSMKFNDYDDTQPKIIMVEVKNIADLYDAPNITFWLDFPNSSDGWYMNLNSSMTNLTANFSLEKKNLDDTKELFAQFFIQRFTTKGKLHNITAHANLLYNGSWINFSQKLSINVTSQEEVFDTTEVITVPPSDNGGSTETPTPPPSLPNSNTGGGTPSAGLGGGTLITYEPTVRNPSVVDLLRGSNKTIQINISNNYRNKYFADISIGFQGYYANQLSFYPEMIDILEFNKTAIINLTVNAPSYFGYSVNPSQIFLDYLVVNTGLNRSTGDNGSFSSNITIIVNEVDRSDSLECLEKSILIVKNISENTNFSIGVLEDLLEEQQKAIAGMDFTLAAKLCKDISSKNNEIFELSTQLDEIEKSIFQSIKKGYELDNVVKLFNITNRLFSEGRYDEVKDNLGELEETYLIQIKLEDSMLWNRFKRFIRNNYGKMIIFFIIASILSSYVYMRLRKRMIASKLQDLKDEKEEVKKKLKDLQEHYFNDKLVGKNFYEMHTKKYKERLSSIDDLILLYESKQASFTIDDTGSLEEREKKIMDLLKDLQKRYYMDSSIDKKSYDNSLKAYKKTLAKIKKDKSILENKKPNRLMDRMKKILIEINERLHKKIDQGAAQGSKNDAAKSKD